MYIQLIDIKKSYDGVTPVVKCLNLAIKKGEFVTLLGPSGSGKTTTLMMLAGFERPDSGDIIRGGESMIDTAPHQRNIGMVFQSYALFPHMTVFDNVAFSLTVRKQKDIDARVHAILETVEMADYADRYPSQLSGGQQQRVALARALVFEPSLVLMDEPLGALDKQLREQMQVEIKEIQQKLGLTVVYVTHDQTEALAMSDRIAVFNDGEIQQIDDPVTLYENPANDFVAGFLGENNKPRWLWELEYKRLSDSTHPVN